jgi:hypothetical protein
VAIIKLLIQRGADVNAVLNGQETLIHYLFQHAQYRVVCAFLDCRDTIDLDLRDQSGRIVMLAACDWMLGDPEYLHPHPDSKEPSIVGRLLSYRANITAVSKKGGNALHHLLDNPHIQEDIILEVLDRFPEACKILMEQRDTEGFLPFYGALRIIWPGYGFP